MALASLQRTTRGELMALPNSRNSVVMHGASQSKRLMRVMANRRARGFDVAACGVGLLTAGDMARPMGPAYAASGGDGRMAP